MEVLTMETAGFKMFTLRLSHIAAGYMDWMCIHEFSGDAVTWDTSVVLTSLASDTDFVPRRQLLSLGVQRPE